MNPLAAGMTKRPVSQLPRVGIHGDKPPNKPIKAELAYDDPVYQDILVDFQGTDIRITKVERLSNDFLIERYSTEKSLLHRVKKAEADDGSEPDLNERYLYHGTPGNRLEQICREGFDSRLAKNGCFGSGIYFSDQPQKCVKYAERGNDQDYFIILVRVLLGESKVYEKGVKDPTLRREPIKDREKGTRFDSVEGFPRQHKEFVVYETRRTLPELIITYAKPKPDAEPKAQVLDEKVDTSKIEGSDDSESDTDSEVDDADNLIDSSGTSDDEDAYESVDESSEDGESEGEDGNTLLLRLSKEFSEATGERSQDIIDRCLLKADLNVEKAVQIFMQSEEEDVDVIEEITGTSEVEPKQPRPNTDGWDDLSKEEQKDAINRLINDFLLITGLEDTKRAVAKEYLKESEHDLDKAVYAFYADDS